MMNCPSCNVQTEHRHLTKEVEDGIKITYSGFICPQCGLEVETKKTAGSIQEKLKKAKKLKRMME